MNAEQKRVREEPIPTDFYRPEKARPLWRRLLPLLSLAVLVLLIDAVFSFIQIRSALNSTALELDFGRTALLEGRLLDAERAFGRIEVPLDSARNYRGHPGVSLTRSLFENDHEVLDRFIKVSENAQEAGLEAVRAATVLGGVDRDDFAATLFSEGRIQLQLIDQARQHITAAQRALESSQKLLAAAPDPVFPFLDRALRTSRSSVAATAEAAGQGDLILDLVPRLAGGNGIRRYLVLFLSPAEGRGSGGSLALYAVITADDGRLELGRVHPFTDLQLGTLDRIEAPGWYLKRYAKPLQLDIFDLPSEEQLQDTVERDPGLESLVDLYAGLASTQSRINFSPDIPTVSDVTLQLLERHTGQPLDGVITFDPIALGELTVATGPVVGEGLSTPITPENAEQVTLLESYLEFGGDIQAQVGYTRSLIRRFWEKLVGGDADAIALVEALGSSIRSQHVRFFARDEIAQSSLTGLGATGSLAAEPPRSQLVYHNSLGSRIDYFLQRHLDVDVRLKQDGSAYVTTTAEMTNTAPNGPPSALLGPFAPNEEPGTNHMQLNFLLPEGAQVLEMKDDEGRVIFEQGKETSYPVVWNDFSIPSGETLSVSVTYVVQNFVADGEVRLKMLASPTISPDAYELTVTPPPGRAIAAAEEPGSEITLSPARVTLTGFLDQPREFLIRIR